MADKEPSLVLEWSLAQQDPAYREFLDCYLGNHHIVSGRSPVLKWWEVDFVVVHIKQEDSCSDGVVWWEK